MEPTLTDEELRGVGEPDSNREREAHEDYDAAKEALEKVNVEKLFSLYEKAVRQHGKMEKLFLDTSQWSIRTKDELPLSTSTESETVVGSMEKVALAAIGLARLVANLGGGADGDADD